MDNNWIMFILSLKKINEKIAIDIAFKVEMMPTLVADVCSSAQN
ncbi:hypothetical protein J19TS1_38510 [Heyndrickxia oleronia]|nr:hypothetical protein J19TS1_38510 [Heyndrickxia oleronia]